MTSQADRRRFLKVAGTGIAASVAGVSALKAGDAPPAVPAPDADTKAPAQGSQPPVCVCDPASTLIFAGVAGRVDPLMKGTASAETILAIEGCPMDCTRKTLEQAGFKVTQHIRITDLGLVKGQSPATDENVDKVVAAGKKALGAKPK